MTQPSVLGDMMCQPAMIEKRNVRVDHPEDILRDADAAMCATKAGRDGCKMNRTVQGKTASVPQRAAVVAMFTELNEIWYLSHARRRTRT
jgi:hypothetical protein